MELWALEPRKRPTGPCVSDQRGRRQRQDGLTWSSLDADVLSFGPCSRGKQRNPPCVSDQRGLRQHPDGLTWASLGADVFRFGSRSRGKQRNPPCVSDQRGLRQRQDGLTWSSLGAYVWSFGPRSRAKPRKPHASATSVVQVSAKTGPRGPDWALTYRALGTAAPPNLESPMRQRVVWSTSAPRKTDVDSLGTDVCSFGLCSHAKLRKPHASVTGVGQSER